MTDPCEHEKVYSGETELEDPARFKWICRHCLKMGSEPLPRGQRTDQAMYWRLAWCVAHRRGIVGEW